MHISGSKIDVNFVSSSTGIMLIFIILNYNNGTTFLLNDAVTYLILYNCFSPEPDVDFT